MFFIIDYGVKVRLRRLNVTCASLIPCLIRIIANKKGVFFIFTLKYYVVQEHLPIEAKPGGKSY